MKWLTVAALLLTGLCGTLVVLSRDPRRQILALAAFGLVLTVLFFVLQAPDVALSELAVNTVATPLLFLVALASAAINARRQ